jgi:hypothetical protein
MTYTEYTVRISIDPSYYGTDCTQPDADRIADALSQMVSLEFPGITIIRQNEIGGRGVNGPDSAIVDDIHQWIEASWTAAL